MDWTNRVTVLCFAASYALGLAAEILRAVWPTRSFRWVATAVMAAGFLAHTLFLLRLASLGGRLPIATQFESLLSVSWLLAAIHVFLLLTARRMAVGLFLLPVSLGLILFAATLTDRGTRGTRETGGNNPAIALAHGMAFLAGTVLVVVALVAALMYLVKVWQLRAGVLSSGVRLPSLERLDSINAVAVYLAWGLLTAGILLGFALRQLAWSDLKVIATSFSWVVFTILTQYRFRPEARGRRVALLTIAAALLVLVSVLGDPFFGTQHQAVAGEKP